MTLQLGDTAPDFEADTTEGHIHFHEWMGDSWAALFIKLILVYPMTTGRNFDEVLRVIDSLRLTAKHKVATPVNWKQGEDVIIVGSVTDEAARKVYPEGWRAPRPYIRIVPQPRG
jgi:alkyl hydroperoxide reductase subunit AhpC